MMIEADSYDPLLFFYLDSVFMFRELLSGRVLLLVKYQEKGMIRMPRKRRSTKSRIVKAAWNLFYKNGYEQTTVEDIINAAKTSKGTFYHYFKGKEALLNSLSYLFDQKYEDLAAVIDPNLSSYDKLLFLNHELFYMIETSVDIHLLAYLYSSQLITKDKKSLSDKKRIYFKWLTEIMEEGLAKGEFKSTSTAAELMDIYAMYERALLYDWALFKGKFSLTERSDKLVPHVLDTVVEGIYYQKGDANRRFRIFCWHRLLLHQTFMNIFLFDSDIFHHIKNLFPVCQVCTPGKSTPR